MFVFDMTDEQLKNITHTIGQFEVKDVRYKKLDNILVALVKHPIFGKPNLHDGFICVQFNIKGYPLNKFKGVDDLRLRLT